MNDEFVIYDPDQAMVDYIIHYTYVTTRPPNHPSLQTSWQQATTLRPIFPKVPFQKVSFTAAELRKRRQDPVQQIALDAEGHFYKMASRGRISKRVKSIDVVLNLDLQEKFDKKIVDLKKKGYPADPIFAYHGTRNDPSVIDNILKKNFDPVYWRRQAHGMGNYFSEFPDVSLGYGSGLILCRLLTGREYSGEAMTWPLYDSKV